MRSSDACAAVRENPNLHLEVLPARCPHGVRSSFNSCWCWMSFQRFSEVLRYDMMLVYGIWYVVFDTRGEVCLGREDNSLLPCLEEGREHSPNSVQLDYLICLPPSLRLLWQLARRGSSLHPLVRGARFTFGRKEWAVFYWYVVDEKMLLVHTARLRIGRKSERYLIDLSSMRKCSSCTQHVYV